MKDILIIPNKNKDCDLSLTKIVATKLSSFGASLYMTCEYSRFEIPFVKYISSLPEILDLIIVIGGDGSILDASVTAIDKNVPLLGINLGKIGYLSEVDIDNLDLLDSLFDGAYYIEDKMLLELSCKLKDGVIKSERLAVNDIIISHDNYLGIAEFSLEKSEAERVNYRADGIIFSTPVGSTAYSLSAGGPIVSHGINAILVTPIAPHSFFNRSIIFSPYDKLKIRNDGKAELKVSVDGRFFSSLFENEECNISVSEKSLRVLSFNRNNTFSTLFKKMRILEDVK